jgi:uncharacterized protein YbcV (DUF1398 family)
MIDHHSSREAIMRTVNSLDSAKQNKEPAKGTKKGRTVHRRAYSDALAPAGISIYGVDIHCTSCTIILSPMPAREVVKILRKKFH